MSGMRMGGRLGNGHSATMVGRAERPNWTWRIAPVRSPLPNHKGCSMLALGERARGCGPGNGDAERQGCDPTGSRKAATGLDECRQTTDRPHKDPKWSGRGSNPQPPHCERGALPIELPPQSDHWNSKTYPPATPRRKVRWTVDAPWPISIAGASRLTCHRTASHRPADR